MTVDDESDNYITNGKQKQWRNADSRPIMTKQT